MKSILYCSLLCIGFALASLCGGGCMWTRARMNDPDIVRRARSIVPGKTHENELSRILQSEPGIKMPGKNGTLYVYTFSETKTGGLMLILVNFTKSNTVTASVYVDVAPNGVVSSVHIPGFQEPRWEYWPFE